MTNLNNSGVDQSIQRLFEKLEHVKPVLLKRLSKPQDSSEMSYGQLKRAARFTIRELGYEWIVNLHDLEYRNFYGSVYVELEKIVKAAVQGWHKNPTRVFYDFSNYCNEIGSGIVAKKSLKKFTLN